MLVWKGGVHGAFGRSDETSPTERDWEIFQGHAEEEKEREQREWYPSSIVALSKVLNQMFQIMNHWLQEMPQQVDKKESGEIIMMHKNHQKMELKEKKRQNKFTTRVTCGSA